MTMLQANGVHLNCQVVGDGPLLVMCHGLVFGSIATWYFTAAACLARRFKVVMYDQRGHGKSEVTATGYDPDTLAEDLAAVINHFSCGDDTSRVTLVGHSYGALVALKYALRNSARVARLALIDAPLPASRYVFPSMATVDSPVVLESLLPCDIKEKISQGSRAARRLRERMDFLFLHSSLRQDVAAANDIDDALLKALSMPVLCLYGRHSDCRDAGERLARVIPHGELRLLDCGHFIPIEAPEEMTRALDGFL